MTDYLDDQSNPENCMICSRRSPVFNKLDEADLIDLNQKRYSVNYAQGEILFKQGSAMNHLISLTQGFVALILESGGQKQQLFKICKPYDLIGGLGIFHGQRHHFTAMALNDVRACYLEGDSFLKVFHRNPILSDSYMKQISIETQQLHSLLIDLTTNSLQKRIANAIMKLQEIADPVNQIIFNPRIMALMVNGARDNIVRVIKEWKIAGVLETSPEGLHIPDQTKLYGFLDK